MGEDEGIVRLQGYRERLAIEGVLNLRSLIPWQMGAYIRTGRIIDTGVYKQPGGPATGYAYNCRSSIVMLNCDGASYGVHAFGRTFAHGVLAVVEREYQKTRKWVYEVNPYPNALIDIRTLFQMKLGCCPESVLHSVLVSLGLREQ